MDPLANQKRPPEKKDSLNIICLQESLSRALDNPEPFR
jgi:hypothetical protein